MSGGKCKAVFDTGTSLLTGPTDIMTEVFSILDVNPMCDDYANLPTITYVFEGEEHFTLYPEDYIMKTESTNICKPAMMPLDVDPPRGPMFVLGDVFTRAFYTIFDRYVKSIFCSSHFVLPLLGTNFCIHPMI